MTTVGDILVIGAGPGGVAAGAWLRRAGFDFLVLERGSEVGGTWRDNNYPGCACDIAASLYCFSFAPNPDWKRAYAEQPELRDYLQRTADEFDVTRSIRFNEEVKSARWDGQAWQVESTGGSYTARVLVTATGPWSAPLVPDLPGLDQFPGAVFHSAQWDHDFDLKGKRVAVIGTGASSVQFLPLVQPEVEKLHLFQRTAPWIIPKTDYALSEFERKMYRKYPGALKAMRKTQLGILESLGFFFRHPKAMPALQKLALWNIRRGVKDKALREILTPNFIMGCRRVLLSNTYYPAVASDNVEVIPQELVRIEGSKVIGADGTAREVDAILFGTGFHYSDPPIAGKIRDEKGRTLEEMWEGSPQAYLGTNVHGYPNLFMLLGPNMGSGTGSAIAGIEAQVRYALSALTTMRDNGWHAVEVRADVQDDYNTELQKALGTTVYTPIGCNSNYIDRNGRNSTIWPWSTKRLNKRIRTFAPDEYRTVARHELADTGAESGAETG
ncbi:flavin-containing monooxygenase [Yinghuangia soli]|uniref:NAD(P)/FAD-dependent oxidoreductase n=1 Tax=Yinghuangia soli TaxID=2908204 RepID=A0AA41Q3D8_9ACTN|nr:NAD(P)/FAD-dependent oxidoreductase [Yinghuangia soli]MCF2529674.1 NAD(P)/FAD-dependent oxidoreductase [Yinghuangia soli]